MSQKKSEEQQPQQRLWVGIGCQSGISYKLVDVAIEGVFREYELDKNAIAGIGTIDSKATEAGILDYCRLTKLPLKTFAAEILSTVAVPNPNAAIAQKVRTPSVAEAAAILAATRQNQAVKLLVPKQIFRLPGEVGTVTVAVAQGGEQGEQREQREPRRT
ncbi:cobalamin biosynthesis protein, partial [Anabaena sp. 4-3]|uniref:cobalamin biosynthesis protein n=1 Tax=Anabaena sp. 4-3 TaxID=1811979 RepID=UPI0012E7A18D